MYKQLPVKERVNIKLWKHSWEIKMKYQNLSEYQNVSLHVARLFNLDQDMNDSGSNSIIDLVMPH